MRATTLWPPKRLQTLAQSPSGVLWIGLMPTKLGGEQKLKVASYSSCSFLGYKPITGFSYTLGQSYRHDFTCFLEMNIKYFYVFNSDLEQTAASITIMGLHISQWKLEIQEEGKDEENSESMCIIEKHFSKYAIGISYSVPRFLQQFFSF